MKKVGSWILLFGGASQLDEFVDLDDSHRRLNLMSVQNPLNSFAGWYLVFQYKDTYLFNNFLISDSFHALILPYVISSR